MDKEDENFEYDEELDILTIDSDKVGREAVLGSLVLGNLTFDIGSSGSFLSIEVDNASEVFNISQKMLSKIKDARIKTSVQGKTIMLIYIVNIGYKEYEKSYILTKNKIPLTC